MVSIAKTDVARHLGVDTFKEVKEAGLSPEASAVLGGSEEHFDNFESSTRHLAFYRNALAHSPGLVDKKDIRQQLIRAGAFEPVVQATESLLDRAFQQKDGKFVLLPDHRQNVGKVLSILRKYSSPTAFLPFSSTHLLTHSTVLHSAYLSSLHLRWLTSAKLSKSRAHG